MKRYLSLLLAAAMVIGCLSLAACSTRQSAVNAPNGTPAAIGQNNGAATLIGDVNGDNSADMKDVLVMRKAIAGMGEAVDTAAGDMNGDNSIDMKDVLKLRRCIAGMDPWPQPTEPTGETSETTPTSETSETEPTGETSETARTSSIRKTTQSTHHEKIHFDDQPQIDFISGTETLGAWWWHLSDGIKLDIREEYLDFLEYNHVTEIYYYCYDAITTPNRRNEVHEFVQSAMTRGFRVAFLYDDPNSILEDNTYVTDKLVPNYLAYKAEYPADAVYGLHLDVETKSSLSLIQQYVDNFLVAEVAPAREKGVFIELDLSINYASKFPTYNGAATNYYDVVAQNCDTMCLMSYRTSSQRLFDGTAAARASAKKYNKKVVFGIEMGDSYEGSSVDFSRSSKTVAYKVLGEVDAMLAKESLPAGYGYAIHHVRAWFNLKSV